MKLYFHFGTLLIVYSLLRLLSGVTSNYMLNSAISGFDETWNRVFLFELMEAAPSFLCGVIVLIFASIGRSEIKK